MTVAAVTNWKDFQDRWLKTRYGSRRFPARPLEFERLMKAHGLETRKEQEITGDDETMP